MRKLYFYFLLLTIHKNDVGQGFNKIRKSESKKIAPPLNNKK